MTEFTNGPWIKEGREIWAGRYHVADVWRGYHDDGEQFADISEEEAGANAYLIAAAPDVYEALSIICDYLEMDGRGEGMARIGRAALAKARGE